MPSPLLLGGASNCNTLSGAAKGLVHVSALLRLPRHARVPGLVVVLHGLNGRRRRLADVAPAGKHQHTRQP